MDTVTNGMDGENNSFANTLCTKLHRSYEFHRLLGSRSRLSLRLTLGEWIRSARTRTHTNSVNANQNRREQKVQQQFGGRQRVFSSLSPIHIKFLTSHLTHTDTHNVPFGGSLYYSGTFGFNFHRRVNERRFSCHLFLFASPHECIRHDIQQ